MIFGDFFFAIVQYLTNFSAVLWCSEPPNVPLIHVLLQCVSHFVVLDSGHLGNALKSNPGYLKLRRIRAAQTVSNTVRSLTSVYKCMHVAKLLKCYMYNQCKSVVQCINFLTVLVINIG